MFLKNGAPWILTVIQRYIYGHHLMVSNVRLVSIMVMETFFCVKYLELLTFLPKNLKFSCNPAILWFQNRFTVFNSSRYYWQFNFTTSLVMPVGWFDMMDGKIGYFTFLDLFKFKYVRFTKRFAFDPVSCNVNMLCLYTCKSFVDCHSYRVCHS